MPNAREITLDVEGEVVRFTQMNTGEWWQMGSQSKYKSSFTARGAMLNLIWEQKQIIANLTTELADKDRIITNYQEREASVCPEDFGFEEVILAGREENEQLWEANKLLKTELETVRAESAIYRAQRDQVSAETTIDEERFDRLFDAVRDEHGYTVGRSQSRHVAREVLSRYLAEMTAMKPAPGIYVGTLTAEQMSNDEIILPPPTKDPDD